MDNELVMRIIQEEQGFISRYPRRQIERFGNRVKGQLNIRSIFRGKSDLFRGSVIRKFLSHKDDPNLPRLKDLYSEALDAILRFAQFLGKSWGLVSPLHWNEYLSYCRIKILQALDNFDPSQDGTSYFRQAIKDSFLTMLFYERGKGMVNRRDYFEIVKDGWKPLLVDKDRNKEDDLIWEFPDLESDPFQILVKSDLSRVLREKIKRLNDKDRFIIERYYGIDQEPMSQRQIGLELGVSHERVRQIRVGILQRLKKDPELRVLFSS